MKLVLKLVIVLGILCLSTNLSSICVAQILCFSTTTIMCLSTLCVAAAVDSDSEQQ